MQYARKKLNLTGQRFGRLAAKTARRNNTSGVPGVAWVASTGLRRAEICFKGKWHYLGSYKNLENAAEGQ